MVGFGPAFIPRLPSSRRALFEGLIVTDAAWLLLVVRVALLVALLSGVECQTSVDVGYRLARLQATDDGAMVVDMRGP